MTIPQGSESLATLQALTQALHTPGDRSCLVALHETGISRWSYAEVASAVQRLASGLMRAGVGRGDHVALLATNRPEWVVACLAIISAGAAVVPFDTQIAPDVLQRALHDSGARTIFTTTDYLNRLNNLDLAEHPRPILLDVAPEDARGWRALLADPPTNGAGLPTAAPGDTAALFYTSGTTGIPKGVPLTHANLAFQVRSVLEKQIVHAADVVMLPLPMYHVYPFTVGMLAPLAYQVPIVLPQGLTGPQIVRAMREGKPTTIIGVPRLYRALYTGIEAQIAAQGKFAATLFERGLSLSTWLRNRLGLRAGKVLFSVLHRRFGPQVRLFCSGGSALDPDLAQRLQSLGWDIAIGYGLTETAPLLTMNLPGSNKLASAGNALPGIDLRIDPIAPAGSEDAPTPAPPDQDGHREGEIIARGPSVFSGYRNLPDQTAEVITSDGWFRTGDLGYLDADGYLYISGRASTLIVTEGGKNIQPEPLEEVYQGHPFIKEIGILQHESQLVALIVPEMDEVNRLRNGDVDGAIREALNEQSQRVATYQRVADYATTPEPLVKTNLGKLRRHILKQHYIQAKQGIVQTGMAEVGPLPLEDMTEQDQALLAKPAARQVWDWLAERYADRRLTPDTSPQLDLGIDSLSWLNLTLDISQRTGVELSEAAIKRISTVRDLLREVAEAPGSAESGGVSPVDQPEAVLTAEQRRWLEPRSPAMKLLGNVLFGLNRGLVRTFCNLEVVGLENLPDQGPFVLTPNHTSYLDAFAVAAALTHAHMSQTYWAGSVDVAFSNPVVRFLSRVSQTMPVAGEGTGTGRSSLAFAAATLKNRRGMTWFPEGRVSRDGKLMSFRQGLGVILQQIPVPVVPVLIQGTRDALPPDASLPRPAPIRVTFGPPCDPHDLARQGTGEHEPARIVQALHDRMAEMAATAAAAATV